MPIPKAPFFSLSARGSLGRVITIARHRAQLRAKTIPTPSDPQTDAQLAQRAHFSYCASAWNELTEPEKHYWRTLRYPPNLTGYQRYMRHCLGVPMPPPVEEISLWLPDAPPETPSAFDDEFDDAAFDAVLWTDWDPSNVQAITEPEWGLDLGHINHPAHAWAGIFQPRPPGVMSLYTRVAVSTVQAGSIWAAIIVGQDLLANPATSAFFALSLERGAAGCRVSSSTWTSHLALALMHHWTATVYLETAAYLRIRFTDGGASSEWSLDGMSWIHLGFTPWPWPPQQIGLAANNRASGFDIRSVFSFFRYQDNFDWPGWLYGDRITIGPRT